MGRPRPYQDRVWTCFYDDLLGPYTEPSVMLGVMEQMDLSYDRCRGTGSSESGPGRGVPRAGFRCHRYLGDVFGANGASTRFFSLWEFWIPGCLSESSSRFRDYFLITRERFDLIYEAAAESGLFDLNPSESLYSHIHPEGPDRPDRHQDDKKIPLCSKALPGVPKKGEIDFVHYYEEQPGSDLVKREKGSPFKSTIVDLEYKEEGIMYTV
jgi:hypothetical protein